MDRTPTEEKQAAEDWARNVLLTEPKWRLALLYEVIAHSGMGICLDTCRGIIERREA